MKAITKEWLDRAKDDLDTIEKILDDAHLTNVVAFHAQQAVEKTFKAVIEEFQLGFVKTHQLEFLFGATKAHLSFKIDLTMLKRLDEVYIEARYPSDMGLLPYGKPTAEDAKKFHEFAKEIYENINTILT
jgi:HEPN domain-containing protein